ncbi:MAG: hypothetical protein K2I10_06145, partial [Lachnospiraceae bacterium]|nr:hypothetical protein [Lachnospiraceae bacterium]
MNEIIYLEKSENFDVYNPLFIFNEDLSLDNHFCILKTNVGNIAFSYYDLGVEPNAVVQKNILFLSFGASYYVLNLNDKKLLYQRKDSMSIIFEIIKFDLKDCVVFIGELTLLCFNLDG